MQLRNRQGWDFGSQYRSAIFFHDAEQERLAIASRDEHQSALAKPIVTQIAPVAGYRVVREVSAHHGAEPTVAPAMTAEGRPSRLWDPRRIDITFLGQQLAREPVARALEPHADAPRRRQHR